MGDMACQGDAYDDWRRMDLRCEIERRAGTGPSNGHDQLTKVTLNSTIFAITGELPVAPKYLAQTTLPFVPSRIELLHQLDDAVEEVSVEADGVSKLRRAELVAVLERWDETGDQRPDVTGTDQSRVAGDAH